MRLILIIICLALFTFTPAAHAVSVTPPSQDEKAMLALINQARAARGMSALRFEGRLQRTARWMNRDMIAASRFSHTDSLGRSPFTRLDRFGYSRARSWRGENLAAGNRQVRAAYAQWWHSLPHRRNMLNRNYRYVGIARHCSATSTYGCYWTTEFGGHWTGGFARF